MTQRDQYGRTYITEDDAVELLYQNPELDLTKLTFDDATKFNQSTQRTYYDISNLNVLGSLDISVEEYDRNNQSFWHIPEKYIKMDVAKYILDLCTTQEQLQRVGDELMLFLEKDLFDVLKLLIYISDTARKHKIVLGVGRGSSVSSYVLYLIGIHKVDSMLYDLDIKEFLK
jgi:DNA polymerase III alpha subunit